MAMTLLFTLIAGLLLAPGASEPGAAPPPTSLGAAQSRAVVDAVVQKIDAHYVVRERRAKIVAAIRAAQKRGRYEVSDPTELAARLGDDLAAAGSDKHLYMRWSPAEYRAAQAPADSGEGEAYFAALGRRRNQGVEELRILGGNVRYMRYTQLLWEPDVTGAVLDDAMRFLKGGDAVILDLRGNGGGHPGAVQYLVSHFMGEPGRLLMTFHNQLEKTARETRVLDQLPGGRMVGKPLYVLIDSGTASAAEELASHIKLFKLGMLVGRTTAGAAHNNAAVPIAPGFIVSVSVGRPVHAVSGGNWEGKGVAPDRATSSAGALAAAHIEALRRLDEQASDPTAKAAYAWALAGLAAEGAAPVISAAELAGHAGRYGDRTIRVERGALVYARPGREDVALTPMGGGLFALTGISDRRIRFTAGAMELLFADGQRQSFARIEP